MLPSYDTHFSDFDMKCGGKKTAFFVLQRGPNELLCWHSPNDNISLFDQACNHIWLCHVDDSVLNIEIFSSQLLDFRKRVTGYGLR